VVINAEIAERAEAKEVQPSENVAREGEAADEARCAPPGQAVAPSSATVDVPADFPAGPRHAAGGAAQLGVAVASQGHLQVCFLVVVILTLYNSRLLGAYNMQ
jgi:hypothetical protein